MINKKVNKQKKREINLIIHNNTNNYYIQKVVKLLVFETRRIPGFWFSFVNENL